MKSVNSKKENFNSEGSIEILKLEFDYAKSTSLQSQSDRLAIVNFFIAVLGQLLPYPWVWLILAIVTLAFLVWVSL